MPVGELDVFGFPKHDYFCLFYYILWHKYIVPQNSFTFPDAEKSVSQNVPKHKLSVSNTGSILQIIIDT